MPVVYRPDGSIDDELPVWVDAMLFVLGALACVVLPLYWAGLLLMTILAHWQ